MPSTDSFIGESVKYLQLKCSTKSAIECIAFGVEIENAVP